MSKNLTAQETAILRKVAAPEVFRLRTIEDMEKRLVQVQERQEQERLLISPAQNLHTANLKAVFEAVTALKAVNSEAAQSLAALNQVKETVANSGGQISATQDTITRLKNGGF